MDYESVLKAVDDGDVEYLIRAASSEVVKNDTYGYFLIRFNDNDHRTSLLYDLIEAGYNTSLLISRYISYQAVNILESFLYDYGVKLDGFNLERAYSIENPQDILVRVIDRYTTPEALAQYEALKFDHEGVKIYEKYLKECEYCKCLECECEYGYVSDDNDLYEKYGLVEYIDEVYPYEYIFVDDKHDLEFY